MKATKAFAAKRAVVDLLTSMAAAADRPLWGWQVAYRYPLRDIEAKCIYGGGVRFTQDEAAAEGVARSEIATVSIYLRYHDPDGDGRDGDLVVEATADLIADELALDPHLGDNLMFTGVRIGQGDYQTTEDAEITVLGLQLEVRSLL